MAAATAIAEATAASNQSNTDLGTARQRLEDDLAALRKRLSGLLSELLPPDDARWYPFGFERPSDPETPEVPENIVITGGGAGSGRVFIDWDDARRADNYRVTITDTATPAKVLASKLVEESEATFDGLPAGHALRVSITARNDAGESQLVTAEGTAP